MNDLTSALKSLRSVATQLVAEVAFLDAKIEQLQAERSTLTATVVSKADFIDYCRRDLDRRGARYGELMAKEIGKRSNTFAQMETALASGGSLPLPFLTGSPGIPVVITEEAIYWFFGEQIAAGLARVVDLAEWTDDVLPVFERKRLIAGLDTQIAETLRQREELASQLIDAGLTQ